MSPEEQIHCAVADCLRLANRRAVWFHPANGGKRNIIEAKKFKRMGVLPGVSDFIILQDGIPFALELKSEKGRATDHQRSFMASWCRNGGYASIAYGVDEAISMLKTWGVI